MDLGSFPAQWYYYWHWHDGTPKELDPLRRPTEPHTYPEPRERVGLNRFETDHTRHTPWNGRPKRLHATDCPVWMANHNADYYNCCIPTYDISKVLGMEVVPRGFIPPYDPNPDLAHIAQMEIDYLAGTQHAYDCRNKNNAKLNMPENPCCRPPELAPEVLLMHERGMEAVAIDQQPLDPDGVPIEIPTDRDGTAYHIPPREMQALADWERRSWMSGPIYKWRYKPTDEGKITLTFETLWDKAIGQFRTNELSDEEITELNKYRIATDKASCRGHKPCNQVTIGPKCVGIVPDAEELKHDLNMVATLREEWGSQWFKNNPVNPGLPIHPFDEPELDDPYRYAFFDEDTRRMDTEYAGPVDLSYDLDDDQMTRREMFVITTMVGEQVALEIDDDDLYSNSFAVGVGESESGISHR